MSPGQQQLYDQNNKISTSLNDLAQKGIGFVGDATSHPLTASGFGGVQTSLPQQGLQTGYDYSNVSKIPGMDNFGKQRDDVTNALMSRLQPQLDRARAAKENQLANQGIMSGSEAYKTEQGYLGQNENDAHMQALLSGSQEQGRLFGQGMDAHNSGISDARSQGDFNNQAKSAMFGQGLSSGQFGNQAQQQAIQEADYFKNQPLNMLNALRSGNQVQMPSFGNVAGGAQVAAAPVYAATNDQYQAQLDRYKSQQSTFGALLGGLGTLGGAAITKWSDRRLKENIQKIGERISGLGLYLFNYIGNSAPEIGYMADEVEQLYPEAISYLAGFAQVNYRMVR